MLPDSSSASGGLSFLTVQEHLASGDNARDLEVPVPKRIDGQVEISASALPDNGHCDYLAVGDQPIRIAARVEFARVGAIGGVQVLSLPKTSVTVDTGHGTGQPSDWTFSTYLVPGTYDIYVQPVSTAKCAIPPAILRGVEVTEKSPAWGLPATIDLPAPKHLRGTVERRGGTLVGWQVEVIEPQERRVISTSAVLGPTNGPTSSTNFVIDYQPWVSNPSSKTGIAQAVGDGPLIRLTPPAEMASQAPTVYWDLATIDLDGNGVVSLDLSGLPPPEQQIVVTGQVRGQEGTTSNVRSGIQFFSTSLDGGMGLTANFSQSVTTDEGGNFEARLLAGQYRVVAVPDGASATDAPGLVADHQGSSTQTMSSAHPWAITERQWTATQGSSRLDLELFPKRVLDGNAWAGIGSPALGAQLEAVPTIIPSQLGVLKGALGQTPVLPQSASVMVSETDAHFAVALDPGAFDISLRPAQNSNFAWWVWPAASITPPRRRDRRRPSRLNCSSLCRSRGRSAIPRATRAWPMPSSARTPNRQGAGWSRSARPAPMARGITPSGSPRASAPDNTRRPRGPRGREAHVYPTRKSATIPDETPGRALRQPAVSVPTVSHLHFPRFSSALTKRKW